MKIRIRKENTNSLYRKSQAISFVGRINRWYWESSQEKWEERR